MSRFVEREDRRQPVLLPSCLDDYVSVIALISRPAELAEVSYVIDGDTLVIAGGERVRLLGIDAPEMPPRASCDREVEMALAAKARLIALLRQPRWW